MTKWQATAIAGGKKYTYSPRLFPYTMVNDFLMDGKSRLYLYYKNKIRERIEPLEVTADEIRKGINATKDRLVGYNTEADEYLHALLTDDYNIEGNLVAVIGCSTAWYACMALGYGAKGVVVISERKVVCEDERIVFAHPNEVNPEIADYAISVCEIQDAGLGRYDGEMIPDKDVDMMGWARSVLKPNGKMFLGVPCGADMLVWNRGRIYGKHRLKKVMDGWTLRSHVGYDDKQAKAWTVEENFTPLFVLEKQ